VATEVELKLAASRPALTRAMRLPWLKRIAADTARTEDLTSVYFDTRKFALRDQGVTLRVRAIGAKRLQTIKRNCGALVERDEWEQEIEGERPDLRLARQTPLAPLLTGKIKRQLRPVFETRVSRAVVPLRLGKSEIELAIDAGRVETARKHSEIAEIEVELKHGDRHDVAALVRRLARSIPVSYGAIAKSDRGYALLDGALDEPVFARPIALPPASSAADAFIVIGFECLRHVAANEAAVRRGDGEGVHQMRVGLRRLRAAISLFKDMLQGPSLRPLKAELVWLTEQLGPARDYDVFISTTVDPLRSQSHDHRELDVLESELVSRYRAGLAQAKAAVASARYRKLMLDVALWLFDGDWFRTNDPLESSLRNRPAGPFAKDEIRRRIRKIEKKSRKLDQLEPPQRHKLRIAVKKVRYGREFFACLGLDRRRRVQRKTDAALKALQSALGSLNDMNVHARLAQNLSRAKTASQAAFAIGYLIGQEKMRSKAVLSSAAKAADKLRRVA
jgi:inorganic triphosphatase YgiF